MTGHHTPLRTTVEAGGAAELVTLARRNATTAKRLCEAAVRHLIVAAHAGTMPDLPPLGPADPLQEVTVWLLLEERDALHQLALAHHTAAEALASLAVRHILSQARGGAMPMLTPLRAPEPETEPASASAARINFGKARLLIDRLHFIAEHGLDASGRAALKDIDDLKTIAPY